MKYKNLRKVVMNEYDDGLITLDKLGEKLLRLTNLYRKSNNIAKLGSHTNLLADEDEKDKDKDKNNSREKVLGFIIPKKEEYILLRKKGETFKSIAQQFDVSVTTLKKAREIWKKMI